MTSITKKLTVVLFALLAAVCLVTGVILSAPAVANADAPAAEVTIDDTDYLRIEEGTFLGLKDDVSNLLGTNKYYAIKLPSTVTKIGAGTSAANILGLNYARRLVSITLPEGLTEIGNYAFSGCTSLGSVNIPAAVTSIGNYAFSGCTTLTTVSYVASTTGLSIGDSAFRGCTSFETITVPVRVTKIGANAYRDCTSVKTVNYYAAKAEHLTASPFVNIGKADVVIGNGTDSVIQVPTDLFRGTAICSVTFDKVEIENVSSGTFGQHAFSGCASLTSVTFKSNCKIIKIDGEAFKDCTSLSELSLPAGLTTIDADAFNGCSSLLEITVPDTVTTVGSGAFNCGMLLEVVYAGEAELGVANTVKIVSDKGASNFFTVNGDYRFYDSGSDLSLVKFNGTGTAELPSIQEVNQLIESSYPGYKIYQKAFMGNTGVTAVNITAAANVLEIGEMAFNGCTSLENVTFPNLTGVTGISIIKANAFQNCTALTEISLPASLTDINAYAFDGCVSLAEITFNKVIRNTGSEVIEAYNLRTIDSYAFRNTAIAEINLPETVTSLGRDVFADCGNLAIVYLPTGLNSVQTKVFGNNAAELTLIAQNYQSYDSYVKTNHPAFSGIPLTYLTQMKLHYGEETADIGWRADDEKLPVWAGSATSPAYETSVWYKEAGFVNKILNKTALLNYIAETSDTLNLYSKTMLKPKAEEFAAKELTYKGSAWGLTESDLLQTAPANISDYKLEIASYSNPFGVVSEAVGILNAGNYTLSVNISNYTDYGTWEEGIPVELTVYRAELTELSALEWGLIGTDSSYTSLYSVLDESDTTLVTYYVYDSILYAEKPDVPEGKEDDIEEVKLSKSLVNYTGNEITVGLKGGDSKITVQGNYTGNKQTNVGQYNAIVRVKLNDSNYRLPLGTDCGSLNGQGITIEDLSNNVYSISKTWYIFSPTYNSLEFEKGGSYGITGWTYSKNGNSNAIEAPVLTYGDIATKDLVKFTLKMYPVSGETAEPLETIAFTYAEFAKVINGVMPAGYYVLTAEIGKTADKDDNEIPAITQTVTFTVEEASIQALGTESKPISIGKVTEIEADYTGDVKFYNSLDQISDVFAFKPEELHPVRPASTIWADKDYDKYYTGFGITVLVAGDRAGYLAPTAYTNGPKAIGTYTIFYNVYAPSYDSSYNDSNVNRSYKLYLKGSVKPTNFDSFRPEYTGSRISVPSSTLYEIIYLDDSTERAKNIRTELNIGSVDDYTAAGTHSVVLMIGDRNTAKWDQSIIGRGLTVKADGAYGEYGIYTFTINRANNSATSVPTVSVPWAWHNYDAEVNAIRWNTTFSDTAYSYELISKTDATKVYYSNPAADQLGFNDADAGEYWIKPSAAGTSNVREFVQEDDEEWGELTVLTADISWLPAHTPHISSFKYGDDNLFTAPTGKFAAVYEELESSVITYICLRTEYAKKLEGKEFVKYDNIAKLKEANGGNAPAGDYVYVFELVDTDNGNYDFVDTVEFTVIKADNYWDIAPVIQGWSYGDYDGLKVNCKSHFGDASRGVYEYQFINANGIPGSWKTSIKLLEENGQLPVGEYKYRVTVDGGENYNELVFDNGSFEVSLAQNSWVDIPNIIGWSEGRYTSKDNTPVAKARFGNVYYTIKNAEGEEIISRMAASELNEEKLRSLGVGSYTLVAIVDGTENYSAMSDEAHFAVFEDSVGMTGLIAATMVFAVIAVGLAVAGVILLIRRNRKIEQEFRKMVRSELRRK